MFTSSVHFRFHQSFVLPHTHLLYSRIFQFYINIIKPRALQRHFQKFPQQKEMFHDLCSYAEAIKRLLNYCFHVATARFTSVLAHCNPVLSETKADLLHHTAITAGALLPMFRFLSTFPACERGSDRHLHV